MCMITTQLKPTYFTYLFYLPILPTYFTYLYYLPIIPTYFTYQYYLPILYTYITYPFYLPIQYAYFNDIPPPLVVDGPLATYGRYVQQAPVLYITVSMIR